MFLPILLYKPKLLKMKGKVSINTNSVRTGMVRLGDYRVSIYPNSGFVWENHGGTVIFNGKCNVGNASAVSVGKNGELIFGSDFQATAGLKIACYHKISFGENVLIGWSNIFIDNDFHKIKKLNSHSSNIAYGEIKIGNENWFGLRCTTMKGAETPDYTIVAGNSVINKRYDIPEYSLIAGSPAKLKFTGVYRDLADDDIDY